MAELENDLVSKGNQIVAYGVIARKHTLNKYIYFNCEPHINAYDTESVISHAEQERSLRQPIHHVSVPLTDLPEA